MRQADKRIAVASTLLAFVGLVVTEPNAVLTGPILDRHVLAERRGRLGEQDDVAGGKHLPAEVDPLGGRIVQGPDPFLASVQQLDRDANTLLLAVEVVQNATSFCNR